MSHPIKDTLNSIMIQKVPSYANKFFYSLGFLSAISFLLLILSGIIMSLFGPGWWLTNDAGQYIRSVHMWSTQAFVLFMILHLLIVFFTSGFKKPRRLTWILGVVMLLFALVETELGYALRGDFSSQWRSLQGADFYNGSGLGYWLNMLNDNQVYGIHIVAIPLLIIGLLALHYLLVRVLGIAKPYRKDVPDKTVPANHTLLFVRGGGLIVLILALAVILPSPYLKPISIQEVAKESPSVAATTLVKEFDGSSDTVNYVDNIAPYTFNARETYVYSPYRQLENVNTASKGYLTTFQKESVVVQSQQLAEATAFFASWDGKSQTPTNNPAIVIVNKLVGMAQAGLYEPALSAANNIATPGNSSTYVLRFLADSGVLEEKASGLSLTTEQYGMLREEGGAAPGAWWLAPIGLLNHTVLSNDANGDRDAGIIFGSFFLVLMAFPFIPLVNQLPDKLKVYKLIWREKKHSR